MSWCLFKRDENNKYHLFQYNKECHSRIIWSCSFTYDGDLFATGSRDRTVKIWQKSNDGKYSCISKQEFEDAVTAVEFIPFVECKNGVRYLLVGLNNGQIILNKITLKDSNEISWEKLGVTHSNISLGGKVKKITSIIRHKERKVQVACCGDDFTVRILSLNFDILGI